MTDATLRNGLHKNGVHSAPPARSSRGFSMRFASGRLAGKLEAALAAVVMGAVFSVAYLILQMPGPLVVHVSDDLGNPVQYAQVACTSPGGERRFAALTDVFGETKWPGLDKGPWRCEMQAPARYFGEHAEGSAVVESRHPATWLARLERPARVLVNVQRPSGAPRAAVAVRAVCPAADGKPLESWEARAGLLDGNAVIWLPHGRTCEVGLVRAELGLGSAGPVTSPVLDCGAMPCTGPLVGGVGAELSARLVPTREQWEALRPPPEPDAEPTPAAPKEQR